MPTYLPTVLFCFPIISRWSLTPPLYPCLSACSLPPPLPLLPSLQLPTQRSGTPPSSSAEPATGSSVSLFDLRELENAMLDRTRLLGDEIESIKKHIRQVWGASVGVEGGAGGGGGENSLYSVCPCC